MASTRSALLSQFVRMLRYANRANERVASNLNVILTLFALNPTQQSKKRRANNQILVFTAVQDNFID